MLTRTAKIHILLGSVAFAAFTLCYYGTLVWMYQRFISPDSYYSHGFLIPFVSGYIIWQRREELKGNVSDHAHLGLAILAVGLAIHLLSMAFYIYSTSGFSILLAILGFVMFVYGVDNTKSLIFPIIYIVFMLPMPMELINAISFPLKMLVAKLGVDIIELTGIPIYREGFNITIPAGNLLVGNPCSGLRSLISFLALGSVYAYLSDLDTNRKWILFLLSVPIAILSNVFRVPILILISHYWGLEAAAPESVWHDASGVFMFLIGLVLMFYTWKALQWKTSRKGI